MNAAKIKNSSLALVFWSVLFTKSWLDQNKSDNKSEITQMYGLCWEIEVFEIAVTERTLFRHACDTH